MRCCAVGGDARGSAGRSTQFERVDQKLLMKLLVGPTGAAIGGSAGRRVGVPRDGHGFAVTVSSSVALVVVGFLCCNLHDGLRCQSNLGLGTVLIPTS